MRSNQLVCTVLPTYNERANIRPLIERLLAANRPPYMVLVVDDNSPDGTWREVEMWQNPLLTSPWEGEESESPSPFQGNRPAGSSPFQGNRPAGPSLWKGEDGRGSVVLLRRIGEKGLTSAIQRGIDTAIQVYGASIVTWMDCDLSMPPEDVPKLVRALDTDGVDVAIGSRWVAGGADVAHGLMARTLSWVINRFAMLLLGRQIYDYTSGFIAARAEVLQQIRLRGDYGEYCIDLLARAARLGYRLQETPYVCVPRTTGDSKTGVTLWDYLHKGRKYVATIIKLWREK